MDSKQNEPRGISLPKQNLWKFAILKEENLRLKWFQKNEKRLEEIANQANPKQVSTDVRNELNDKIFANLRNDAKVRKKIEIEPPIVDQNALYNIMKPIDKEIKDLIYTNVINEGRITYLKERNKVIPEMRYYFTETSNFKYGWNMWEIIKNMPASPYGRKKVIKDSFYRRRNVEWDKEGTKQPARLSPQVCGQI